MKTLVALVAITVFILPPLLAQPASTDAVNALIQQVRDSDLARHRQQPLIASLRAAAASFERHRIDGGNSQLRAFQNKVRAQVRRHDPALAAALIAAAQQIIDDDNLPGLVFDLSRDFSLQSNPNGPWSYGYSATLGGPFQLFTTSKYNFDDRGTPVEVWAISVFTVPAVLRNATTNIVTSDGGQGMYPPGTVWFYPGPSNADDGGADPEDNFGVLRFTVPAGAAGTFDLATAVRSAYTGPISGDTDFHVLVNGTEVFGRSLPEEGSATFNSRLNLTAGDTVDFVIGRGADDSFHGSGLIIDATLTQVQ